MGVTAQALRHTDILLHNTPPLPCLGHLVTVPEPEAYALHKMAINPQRKDKAEKDAQAVIGLWPFLDSRRLDDLQATLSKKELASVKAFELAHGLRREPA